MTDFRGSGWCRASHQVTNNSYETPICYLSRRGFHHTQLCDGWAASFPCRRRERRERERSEAEEEHEGEPFTAEECALPWAQSLHPHLGAASRGVSPSLQSETFPGSTSPHHSPLPTHSWTIISCCHHRYLDKSIRPWTQCLGLIVLQLPHPPPSSRLLPSHWQTHPGPASHPYLTLPGQSCHFHQHPKAGTLQILASILTFVLQVRVVQQLSRKLL